jgi:elongation factor 1-alpha
MVVIGANMGVQMMTKEHIGISLALKLPLFIVITKIDIAPENVY